MTKQNEKIKNAVAVGIIMILVWGCWQWFFCRFYVPPDHMAVITAKVGITIAYPANIKTTTRIESVDDKKGDRVIITYEYDLELLSTEMAIWGVMDHETIFERENLLDTSSPLIKKLQFLLKKFEIQEISPDSLEEIMEVIIRLTIQYGFLQKIKIPLKFFLLNMLEISLFPGIQPNPEIDKDQIHIWLSANI